MQNIDNDLSWVIIISNGCNSNHECGVIRQFLSDLIENVYVFDEDSVDLEIIQNALRSIEVSYHRCPNENCNKHNSNVDFISDLEQEIVFIPLYCNEKDDTYGILPIQNPNDKIENQQVGIIVYHKQINLHVKLVIDNQHLNLH